MNDKKRAVRAALSLILVGLYAAGLIAMLAFSFRAGLILWVVSTLGGIGLLYWIRTVDKRADKPPEASDPEDEVTP